MPGLTWRAMSPTRRLPGSFNGGAGHVPGLTPLPNRQTALGELPSMEGRARARPDLSGQVIDTMIAYPSMEGRARARPDPSLPSGVHRGSMRLQWRAGHVPGLTRPGYLATEAALDSLQWRAGHVPGLTSSNFQ